MCPGPLSENVEPDLPTGLEFFSKTRRDVFIVVTSFHQGVLHHSLQAVLCVLSSLVQEPLCSLRCEFFFQACSQAGLVTGIRLSLHLGSFLSFPVGLVDSCQMVLAPVIPEPLSLKLVGALSQRTPSPENLQGLLLSGRLVWGAS